MNSPLSVLLDEGASQPLFDVKQLVRSVYRFKWIILVLGVVCMIAAAFYAHTLTPIYRASATLLIDTQQQANVVSIQDVYSTGYRGYEYRQTQYELLRSRNLAERVVRELELYKKPQYRRSPDTTDQQSEEKAGNSWFDLSFLKPATFTEPERTQKPELTEEEKEENLIGSLTSMISGGISVSPVNDSQLVEIAYHSPDPAFAAQVVNTLADEYIESYLDAKLSATRKASEWLNTRLSDLKENLKQSEQRLQSFREREKLVDLEGITTLAGQQVEELSQRYSAARERRLTAEAIKREVDRLGNSSIDEYMTIPALQRHELISTLNQIRSEAARKVSELSKRYGVKHPTMIAAKSDLQSAQDQLAIEVKKVVTGISREYQLALRTEESLAAQLEETKNDLRRVNRKEFEFQELQREVDTNRQLYNMFFTRMKETSEAGGFEEANARVIDQALMPRSPVSPNRRLIILSGFFGGILMGAGIAALLGILDNTVKTPEDVKSKLNATLLGTLPLQKHDKNGEYENYWDNHHSQYAESLRTVRTAVVLSGLDRPVKTIVVTSSVPGEGKSSIAINLGAAFAHMEKTLVIGADLRRPTIAAKSNISQKHPGLSNFVAGSAELDECIAEFGEQGLHVMPAGLIPSNPLEMLSSRKFSEALDELGKRFDRIIIDSAPLQAVSDSLILATYADSLIYVVKADSTSATVVKRGLERLKAANTPLTGVILNAFNAEKAAKYYGAEGYTYDGYYQSEDLINARR